MTEAAEQVYPIVGAFYRPPAKALLDILAGGTPLILRGEPHNPVDANAVMVLVRSRSIETQGAKAIEVLSNSLQDYGYTIEDVLGQEEWHLGYVPRQDAAKLASKLGVADGKATLRYSAAGAPQAVVGGNNG